MRTAAYLAANTKSSLGTIRAGGCSLFATIVILH